MDYRPEVFREQFPIVKRFVYHLIYYRELKAAYDRLQLQSEFWTHTIDAHVLQAAIHWWMVFGSDGSNPTHWKNLSNSRSEELQQSFRSGLSKHTGIPTEEWQKYRDTMKDFRDKYAAHRELNFGEPVPDFTSALKIAYYYDHWIREVISPDIFEEPRLQKSAEALRQSVAPLINHLLGSTKKYENAE
jgi:hypothetical protein